MDRLGVFSARQGRAETDDEDAGRGVDDAAAPRARLGHAADCGGGRVQPGDGAAVSSCGCLGTVPDPDPARAAVGRLLGYVSGCAVTGATRTWCGRSWRPISLQDCGRQFNERSGGVLNRTSLPSDIIAFVVFCRLRYRLTLRDLSEILLLRGIEVSHEAVRDWENKLLAIMGEELRKTATREAGWPWCELVCGRDLPEGPGQMGLPVSCYRPRRNNRIEQDHRGIKGRIRCMRGFKSDQSAARFCREHGELRDLLRYRRRHNQPLPATRRRSRFTKAARIALDIMQAA